MSQPRSVGVRAFPIPAIWSAKRRISLLSLATALLLSACAADPEHVSGRDGGAAPDYDSVMRIAAVTRRTGDIGGAIGLYRKAASLAPDRPEPRLALGRVLLDAGDFNGAIAAYREAVGSASANDAALCGLANAYLAAGRPDLARETLETTLSHNPRDAKALGALGVALDLAGDHRGAQTQYRSALTVDPTDGSVANNLALSLCLVDDYAQAIMVLRPFADAPGASARQRQTLSLIYGLSGDRDQAARYARLDLDDAETEHNLAYFETLRGLSPEVRARALAAASWSPPRQAQVTDIGN